MAKTLIDIDEEQLAAAQKILKTETKKDTVNATLRQVTALAARRRDLQARLGQPVVAAVLGPPIKVGQQVQWVVPRGAASERPTAPTCDGPLARVRIFVVTGGL
jgi:hypothetical protein